VAPNQLAEAKINRRALDKCDIMLLAAWGSLCIMPGGLAFDVTHFIRRFYKFSPEIPSVPDSWERWYIPPVEPNSFALKTLRKMISLFQIAERGFRTQEKAWYIPITRLF
jgi:hypothetical protein